MDSFFDLSYKDYPINSSNDTKVGDPVDPAKQELKRKIEFEKTREFIQFKWERSEIILAESVAFETYWNRYLPTQDLVKSSVDSSNDLFAISLLGDTTSGKSFIGSFLPITNPPLYLNEMEHQGPTTANVSCFDMNIEIEAEQNKNCLLLDFEGENGTSLPCVLKHAIDLACSSFLPDESLQRRKAVEKYFPKLAYLISNVIILIGTDHLFSNARYVDRVMQFARKAIDDTQQVVYRPALILIYNKYPGEKLWSPDEATSMFYQTNPEAREILKFFSIVRCFVFPIKDQKGITQKTENFNVQIKHLLKLISVIYDKDKKRLLPYFKWLLLVREIVPRVSKKETISMHMILKDILIEKQSSDQELILSFFFRKIYEKEKFHSTRYFHHCRHFAMRVLARLIALRLPHCDIGVMDDLIKNECGNLSQKLWKILDEFRPCEALYMGRGHVKESNRPVFCYQHKGIHGKMHQTSEMVHGASWWRELLENHFDLSTIDKWDGSFETSDKTSDIREVAMQEMLFQMVQSYWKALKGDTKKIYDTFKELLNIVNIDIKSNYLISGQTCFCCLKSIERQDEQYIYISLIVCSICDKELERLLIDSQSTVINPRSNTINENQCSICMLSPRTEALDCGHFHFCGSCSKKMISEYQRCPICKKSVKTSMKIYT